MTIYRLIFCALLPVVLRLQYAYLLTMPFVLEYFRIDVK